LALVCNVNFGDNWLLKSKLPKILQICVSFTKS